MKNYIQQDLARYCLICKNKISNLKSRRNLFCSSACKKIYVKDKAQKYYIKDRPKQKERYEKYKLKKGIKPKVTVKKSKEEIRQFNNEYQRKLTRQLRLQIIEGYGGKCECCGENRFEFLAIDHLKKTGYFDRKVFKSKCSSFYR